MSDRLDRLARKHAALVDHAAALLPDAPASRCRRRSTRPR
jgi:hypothetical protein